MKKISSLFILGLFSIMLAACGSSESDIVLDETPEDTAEGPYSDETTNVSEEEDATEEPLNGTTVESENLNYSMTVADGYELTGEEPNKDMVFNQQNADQSMRIEIIEPGNVHDEAANIVDTLQGSNVNGNVEEIKDDYFLPEGEEVYGYEIETDDGGKVYGYAYTQGELGVKLTIFDTMESPAIDTFIKMAKTIELK